MAQDITATKIDMDSMVSTLMLEGLVAPGQFLAASLSHNAGLRLYRLLIDVVNLQNCVKEASASSKFEPDANNVYRAGYLLDPIKVIETNLVELASYMHSLTVATYLPITNREAVKAAYCALLAGALAIVEARRSPSMQETNRQLMKYMALIGRTFAKRAGILEVEIREWAVGKYGSG